MLFCEWQLSPKFIWVPFRNLSLLCFWERPLIFRVKLSEYGCLDLAISGLPGAAKETLSFTYSTHTHPFCFVLFTFCVWIQDDLGVKGHHSGFRMQIQGNLEKSGHWHWYGILHHSTLTFTKKISPCRENYLIEETKQKCFTHTEAIKKEGITDVFVLCTRGELRKFRVPDLIEKLKDSELAVHHHPFPDGTTLSISDTLGLLDTMKTSLRNGSKCLVQWVRKVHGSF